MAYTTDDARRSISATLDDIAAIPVEIRQLATDPDDREAYDIICRIERRLAARATDQRSEAAE